MCAQSKNPGRRKLARVFLSICFLLSMSTAATFAETAPAASAKKQHLNEKLLNEFIDSAVSEHGLDRNFITQTLQQAQINQRVLDAISRPWEAKPWHQYHPIFLTDKRLKKGIDFWKAHRETLKRAEQELGVPAHIIVAIIGVETFYGSYTGKYSVLDSLYSLGFFYPPRSKFFKKELAQYLKLSQEEGWDPMQQKGSYAGAMGWGQFISSSYRHYSIDFDGDNKRDLLNNPVDAIGSVANYFRKHKWHPGEPIAFKASVGNGGDEAIEDLLSKELKLKHRWQELKEAAVQLNDTQLDLADDTPAKLLALKQPNNDEYWVVLHNFYVITRYNHSPLYAMVVFQLSESLREAMVA